MAMAADFHTTVYPGGDNSLWQGLRFPENITYMPGTTHHGNFDMSNTYHNLPDLAPSQFGPEGPIPEYVQPHDLHSPDTDISISSPTLQAPIPRRHSTTLPDTTSASINKQQLLRRMSLAAIDLDDDSYRPRSTPAKRKKGITGRIAPRSDKHARELELNRKAATKCRNRQKTFVEQLQQRCKREEEKMHIQTSLVSALHDEVMALRNQVLRQSFCDCRFMNGGPGLLS